jgi:hypothetical protein
MALRRGPPGRLIQRAQLGLKNAAMPKSSTIVPTIRRIMLVVAMVFYSCDLFEFDCGSVDEYFCGATHDG